jgi:hypothetical protein
MRKGGVVERRIRGWVDDCGAEYLALYHIIGCCGLLGFMEYWELRSEHLVLEYLAL